MNVTVSISIGLYPTLDLWTANKLNKKLNKSSKHTFHLTWSNNPEDKYVSNVSGEHLKIYRKSVTRVTSDFSERAHLPSSVVFYLRMRLHHAFLD